MPATDTQAARGDRYAPTAWGQVIEDLTVPSGQTCQVRRPGVQGLMAAGILDKVDFLSGIVSEKHIKRVQGRTEIDSSILEDAAAINDALKAIDKVVCYVVLQPEVQSCYDENEEFIPIDDRDLSLVYSDQIDLEDKMFIFNYAVGGSRDLESFREQLDQAVGDLATQPDVEPTTQPDPAPGG